MAGELLDYCGGTLHCIRESRRSFLRRNYHSGGWKSFEERITERINVKLRQERYKRKHS